MKILRFTANNARNLKEEKLYLDKKYSKEVYELIIFCIKDARKEGKTFTDISCNQLECTGMDDDIDDIIELLKFDGYTAEYRRLEHLAIYEEENVLHIAW